MLEHEQIAHDLAIFRMGLLANEEDDGIRAGKDGEPWATGLVGVYKENYDAFLKALDSYENGS